MTPEDYHDFVVQCELAGVLSEAGSFDRPHQERQFRVPAVIGVDCGLLIWRWDKALTRNPPRPKAHGLGLLMEFMRLANARPKTILAFARKWGVLEICKHGLPSTHNCRKAITLSGRWCEPLLYADLENFMEPITYWHFYARQMWAMLKIASQLKQGKTGLAEDWKILLDPGLGRDPHGKASLFASLFGQTVADDIVGIIKMLDRWLSMGDVRPNLVWDEEQRFVSFDNTLFGMLAYQMMIAIGRTEGLGFCSGCGEHYAPKRRQTKVSQRNYCPACGKRAAWRDAKADQRRRQRRELAT
jgi:predicted RNA-binding Zn-ribbon protein involved in translation (DUF1610 family)